MHIIKSLKVESLIMIKSRWTLGIGIALLLILVYAGISSYGFAMQSKNDEMKKVYGNNYKEWVVKDDGAKNIREPVEAIHPSRGSNLSIAFVGIIGPLLIIIFGASTIGSEFGQKTIKIRAAHHGWIQSVRAKIILIILLNVVLIGFAILAGIISNRIVWHYALKSIEIASWIKIPTISYSLIKQFFVLLMGLSFYGLLGALFALISRSTAAGIVIGISAPYLEQYIKAWWLPQSSYGYLLGKQVVYAAGGIISSPPGALMPPVNWYPWLALICWNLLVLAGLNFIPKFQEI